MYDEDYYITEDGFEKVPPVEQKNNIDWRFLGAVVVGFLAVMFIIAPWAIGVATIVRKLFF